jgi:DNA-binding MarR family transcriptional regulator
MAMIPHNHLLYQACTRVIHSSTQQLEEESSMTSFTANPKPLKRSIIKEELVALTGNYKLAVILNQMLYWAERVQDFDEFLLEERKRATEMGSEEPNIELRNGWIYKKAEELAEETMLGLNVSSMLRHLNQLVDKGWLERRRNPKNRMDKTYQYRVNVLKIQRDLQDMGYALEGYPLLIDGPDDPNLRFTNTYLQNANSNLQNTNSELQNASSNLQNARAIPEITYRDYDRDKEDDEDIYDHVYTRGRENITTNRTIGRIPPSNLIDTCYSTADTINAWIGISSLGGQAVALHETSFSPPADPLATEDTMMPGGYMSPTKTGDGAVVSESVTYNVSGDASGDPYVAVDDRMMQHLGRPYIAKENDYRAIKQLLASGVPIDFILDGIDYTFATFAHKNIRSFAYCAEVIKQRWACELAKRQEVDAVDWNEYQPANPVKPSGRTNRRQAVGNKKVHQRDERYAAFYELFPEYN